MASVVTLVLLAAERGRKSRRSALLRILIFTRFRHLFT